MTYLYVHNILNNKCERFCCDFFFCSYIIKDSGKCMIALVPVKRPYPYTSTKRKEVWTTNIIFGMYCNVRDAGIFI